MFFACKKIYVVSGYIKKKKRKKEKLIRKYKYINDCMSSIVFHRSSGNYDGKDG